jgi:hypothetical protein
MHLDLIAVIVDGYGGAIAFFADILASTSPGTTAADLVT